MLESQRSITDVGAFLLDEDDESPVGGDGDVIWDTAVLSLSTEGDVEVDYRSLRAQLTSTYIKPKS